MHAEKLVEKAKDAVDRKAYDLAIELFLQALTLEPNHRAARIELRKAELEKIKAYYPGRISRYFASLGPRLGAWFAGVTKNHEKRMMACERALVVDPKDVSTGMAIGQAAVAAGHHDAAIAAYSGILLVDPDHLEALKGLGRSLGIVGEPKPALEAFEKALKLDPRDQEANRMRKNLAAEVSITATGIDIADHSRDVLKDRAKTAQLEDAGRVVRTEEDLRNSATTLEEQVAANPNDAKLMAELAARYAALKDIDKAIETYHRAYEIQPTNFALREKAGDLRITQLADQIHEAEGHGNQEAVKRLMESRKQFLVKEYRERVQAHPTDLVLHFQLGRALYDVGDVDGAIGEFQQTIRDPRRKIESLTMLGNCFIEKGMWDLAENQLRKALEETPGMSGKTKEILYGLGVLKEKQEKVEDALDEFKKIYEVDIQYKDVAERMNRLKEKLAG